MFTKPLLDKMPAAAPSHRPLFAGPPNRHRLNGTSRRIMVSFSAMKSHRATGMPKGRPPTLPFDLDDQVLNSLERRMDPATRMVRPDWNGMAKELKVSRSTISRVIARLRNSGFIESIGTPTRPGSKIMHISYRLKTS